MSSKTQEQMTDIIEDDIHQKQSSTIKENTQTNINIISNSNLSMTNTNNQNRINTVSVGIGHDTVLEVNDTRQQTTSSNIDDECTYTGDIYAEKKHGKGIVVWSDGRTYTGDFFADKRHGFGTFQTPNTSEFKGLYCQDERFGPGILQYKSLQSADVGLWLNEDLIRLLYSHSKLPFEVHITDKRSPHSSSCLIPSWYSPEELLPTQSNFDFLLKKKSPKFASNNISDDKSSFTQYITEHADQLKEIMHDKRAQLDAYLTSVYDKNQLKDKISKERSPDICPPNETYEQRQIYNYANKFWPLKQRASFPIEDILSNTRSSFPKPGPIETQSLNLFEYSYYGQEKNIRDILIQKLAYVDICDSHGLTALYFAIYNVHINIVNILLDFGANVNQLSDDGLTPLSLAFLLYYGNDPQETINIALEHNDPIVPNPRASPSADTSKQSVINSSRIMDEVKLPSSLESMKMNESDSYGFELTNNLRERIRDEKFRENVFTLINVLLRRGADPTRSDWPLPVLALAVRAGDKQMVELLLNKRAEVNCQLNSIRHASLTPLHIACGCLSSQAVDIVRLLLEYGANVNAESLPGNKEYFSFIDPLITDITKMKENQQHGRTSLHIACTREATVDTLNIIRLLLDYQANPNAVCNGQTPLTLAIALGNESLVDLLLNHESTDPSTALGFGNGNALCTVLSTFYESHWSYAKRIQLIERIMAKSPKVLYPIRFGPKNNFGSSIDFAYYMFFADTRISQTPYHALSNEERAIFSERKELLAYLAKRFREEVSKYEDFLRLPTPTLDVHTQTPSPGNFFASRSVSRVPSLKTEKSTDSALKLTGEFRYCATCGRSTGVRLTLCNRCQKISFCSKICKVNGWNTFHRYECRAMSPVARTTTTTKSITQKIKDFTDSEHTLFKDSILTLKTPPKTSHNKRLPPLSVAKLLRQKRLKKRGKSAGTMPPTLPNQQQESHLSWNTMYNAPENYSFN